MRASENLHIKDMTETGGGGGGGGGGGVCVCVCVWGGGGGSVAEGTKAFLLHLRTPGFPPLWSASVLGEHGECMGRMCEKYLPNVGGFFRVLRFPPPVKLTFSS